MCASMCVHMNACTCECECVFVYTCECLHCSMCPALAKVHCSLQSYPEMAGGRYFTPANEIVFIQWEKGLHGYDENKQLVNEIYAMFVYLILSFGIVEYI